VATPDPYQYWSGAPKHWVHVPAQRQNPPAPEQLEHARRRCSVWNRNRPRQFGEWSVAAVALAVAVAAFVLIGTGSTVASRDVPPPDRTNGTVVR
jgi:hypothetical protein